MADSPASRGMPLSFGIFAETGEFALPLERSSLHNLRKNGLGGKLTKGTLRAKSQSGQAHLGVMRGERDAEDLSRAGWAVMYGPSVAPEIKQELQPLLEHRRNEVGRDDLFKVFEGQSGYQPGQSASEWLAMHNTTLQVVKPTNGVPFYMLIVASPDEVPFEFQCELDLWWGVGRLWFPTPDGFGCYARSVIDYETAATVRTSRQMVLFATNQEFDIASQVLFKNLIDPFIQEKFGREEGFSLHSFAGPSATKKGLNRILTGEALGQTPALLFTGSHGLLRKPDSQFLADTQGAIVCQDWPGGPPKPEHYYAARDLPQNARVHGMVHFLFACYGCGWPQFDSYQPYRGPQLQISPRPMLARLPQVLLGRENGALAVLGHVDRAFSYSYSIGDRPQNQSFQDVLLKLMSGYRLGNATDQLNLRCAQRSMDLLAAIDSLNKGDGRFTSEQVANLWVARDDAKNYIVHGDPAVRLRVNDMAPTPTAT